MSAVCLPLSTGENFLTPLFPPWDRWGSWVGWGYRARVGGPPPWGSAGQKRRVIHSWPHLQKVWWGQTVLACSFFVFLFSFSAKVWRRVGARSTGGGWWWGKDELGRGALRRGRRGRGGKTEKQSLKAQLLSPCALRSTQESTRKIVTVLFRNYALSGKDMLALFFHKWKKWNVMKIHRGREDRRSYLLHTLTTRLGMPRAHTQTLSRTRQVGCWGLHRPPLCAQWRRCHLVEKKQKSLSVGQNPSNPNIPNSKNRIKRKDRHLNKPKSGGKQWKKYFGSDKQILDFDFSCLLFGFPLEQRCVRRPWLASWQGSLQVCFLYLKKKKKTFWIST